MYIKRTMLYDVYQFDSVKPEEILNKYTPDWIKEIIKRGQLHIEKDKLLLLTRNGDIEVKYNDYIVKNLFGDVSVCREKEFDVIFIKATEGELK